jgi:hypothetical protein
MTVRFTPSPFEGEGWGEGLPGIRNPLTLTLSPVRGRGNPRGTIAIYVIVFVSKST